MKQQFVIFLSILLFVCACNGVQYYDVVEHICEQPNIEERSSLETFEIYPTVDSKIANINKKILVLVENTATDINIIALEVALRYYAHNWGFDDWPDVFDITFSSVDSEEWNEVTYRTIRITYQDNIIFGGKEKDGLASSVIHFQNNLDTWTGNIVVKNTTEVRGLSRIYIHEMGHVFKLPHVDDITNIMNPELYSSSSMNDSQLEQTKSFALLHNVD